MDGNRSSKEDSRQDEIHPFLCLKRAIWRGKLVFNLRKVKEEGNRKKEESAEIVIEELYGL